MAFGGFDEELEPLDGARAAPGDVGVIWTRPGPAPNGRLFSTQTSAPGSTAALNDFLHDLNPKGDSFCGFTPDGRVLLTSRSMYPVDGQDTGFGQM